MAQRNVQEYEGGTGTWKSPHYCAATDEQAASYQAMLRSAKLEQEYRLSVEIANGEIVVGQTIKVYRGRKIPQGTMGVVFWVADEPDHFGVYKIGFKDESGVKYFCAINNVDFYFDGADELNAKRVAEAKAEAKAQRKLNKELSMSNGEDEI